MKKKEAKFLLRILAMLIMLCVVFALFPNKIKAQQNDLNYQEFYNQLIPYGQWIENPNYGYVWIPTAGPDFTPYLTNGYWMLTNDGWMWVSNYEWGWAVFHYGRWDYNGSYGWFWVPDNEWGPSWVTWRRSDDYYGWAPMRPGVSISVTFGSDNDVPNDRWIFVHNRDIENHNIGRNHIDRKNNYNIIKNSSVVNKTVYDDKRRSTYVAGPSKDDVQKITGRSINPVTVHERNKPGQNINKDKILIYRPQIQKNNNKNNLAPREVTKLQDVKNISVRDSKKSPAVNFSDNLIHKDQAYQTPNLNHPKKENRIIQSPQTVNMNPPMKNNKTVQSQKPQPVRSPVKENRIDRSSQSQRMNVEAKNNPVRQTPNTQPANRMKPESRIDKPQQQNINIPRNNNGVGQSPKAREANPPRNNGEEHHNKNKAEEDKKENRK